MKPFQIPFWVPVNRVIYSRSLLLVPVSVPRPERDPDSSYIILDPFAERSYLDEEPPTNKRRLH